MIVSITGIIMEFFSFMGQIVAKINGVLFFEFFGYEVSYFSVVVAIFFLYFLLRNLFRGA